EILNEHEKPLKNSKIMLLGIAYKGDIDDLRESPALKVWEELEKRGADVIYHDPYCHSAKWKSVVVRSAELTPESVAACDAVIITTWHKHNIDYRMILDNAKILFDTKNAVVSDLGETVLSAENYSRL
ncbi:MAG: UDP binding domain-containing protein, partial [Cloacibacillus sp.]